MKKILFVTRPLSPPWDEASKNTAFLIASYVSNPMLHLLTTRNFSLEKKNIVCESIYSRNTFGLLQRLELISRLSRKKPEISAYHFYFTPTYLNSKIIKSLIGRFKRLTIQSVPCLPKSFKRATAKNTFFGDIVIVNSEFTKKTLLDCGVKNILKINPGIDIDKFNPGVDTEQLKKKIGLGNEFVVLYPGEYKRLGAINSVVEAIKAFKKDKDLRFILACRIKTHLDKKIEKKIKGEIKNSGLEKRVTFLNTVENMPALLALSGVVLFPIKHLKGKYDFPLVVLEALATGKPVITTEVSPLNEITNQEGIITVRQEDIQYIADIIKDLKENTEKANFLGKSARTFIAEHFNIKNTAQEYEKTYQSLI